MARLIAAFFLVAALALPVFARTPAAGLSEREIRQQKTFAADMAKKGNWREALFRWERVLRATPDDARILNNVAVAWETMGNYDKAEEAYQRALKADPDQREIRENYALFHAFYDRFRKAKEAQSRPEPPVDNHDPADSAGPPGSPSSDQTPGDQAPGEAAPAPPRDGAVPEGRR